MAKEKKRRLEEGEGSFSPLDGYILSPEESRALKKCSKQRPKFNYHRGASYSDDSDDSDDDDDRPSRDNKADGDWDADKKMRIMKIAPSVVSLVSFSGGEIISQTCGTIIEVEDNVNTVVTCLNLIRKPTKAEFLEDVLARNVKIIVRSSDDKSYLGDVFAYDFHYNLLIVKFKSISTLQVAKLRMFGESPIQEGSFQLRRHSTRVQAGDAVVVAGRYFYKPYEFMVATGSLSKHHVLPEEYEYGCNELLLAKCFISKCGDGAPVVSTAGEVIGIAFYEISCHSPFLPIDIVYKWWTHYKQFKELRHPSYGFQGTNMYTASWAMLERVTKAFSGISNGVRIATVLPVSNAQAAGLRENDIVTTCDGKSVQSFLELWNLMCEKVGETVELEVARVGLPSILTLMMPIGDAAPDQLNRWPRYEYK